jgi:hypothetical protein
MRVLIISTFMPTLIALEPLSPPPGDFDAVWCPGDLVGYAQTRMNALPWYILPNLLCIIGNHDAASLTRSILEAFNPEARTAIQWTQNTLNESSRVFLQGLPENRAG